MFSSLSFQRGEKGRNGVSQSFQTGGKAREKPRAVSLSFQRGSRASATARGMNSTAESVEDPGDEDITITRRSDSIFRRHVSFKLSSARRRAASSAAPKMPASILRRQDSILRGPLLVRLPNEWAPRNRYCILDCKTCRLTYYHNADDWSLDAPEGHAEVVGELQRRGDHYICWTTKGGDPFELRAINEDDDIRFWVNALAKLHEGAMTGVVWLDRKKKKKGPKMRWAYYQPITSKLVFYRVSASESNAPDMREVRGGCTVEHAVKRVRSFGGFKYGFACFADGNIWELYTQNPDELSKW